MSCRTRTEGAVSPDPEVAVLKANQLVSSVQSRQHLQQRSALI